MSIPWVFCFWAAIVLVCLCSCNQCQDCDRTPSSIEKAGQKMPWLLSMFKVAKHLVFLSSAANAVRAEHLGFRDSRPG